MRTESAERVGRESQQIGMGVSSYLRVGLAYLGDGHRIRQRKISTRCQREMERGDRSGKSYISGPAAGARG